MECHKGSVKDIGIPVLASHQVISSIQTSLMHSGYINSSFNNQSFKASQYLEEQASKK